MEPDDLLVLRFRDIERLLGDTIRLHREVAAGKDQAVWWGWLYRAYERIPVEVFQSFKHSLQAGPRPVFLYDTGQGLLYSALCDDLQFDEYPERSPRVDMTPAYYNNRDAPAWFRFARIDDADPAEILGTRCVAMPSATPSCTIDLLGSPVRDLKDLRNQGVTLWVLRQEDPSQMLF